MYIRSIAVENFKKFERYQLACRESNILVGPNNSGKSSILDALRIASDIFKYARRRNPIMKSQGSDGVCPAYIIEHSLISVSTDNIARNYISEDAKLSISFSQGSGMHVYLNPDRPVRAYFTGDSPATSVKKFNAKFQGEIIVIPTLGPFEQQERFLTDETVRANENTRLAHRNFRNILLRKDPEFFEKLRNVVQSAWSEIDIQQPERHYDHGQMIQMFYTEKRITREISWSGFGFQVWLQMMMQFLRITTGSILVLDEPDIYLHPDLQKKLIRLFRSSGAQIFLATHSSEIINEVLPGDIVTINSQYSTAKRIANDEDYQKVFNYIGSSENAEFARLARARRIIFFEGKDRRILKKFGAKIAPTPAIDDPDTLVLQAGGYGQWRRVKETGWALKNVFGMEVKVAAIFDRDYRSESQCEEFRSSLRESGVFCCILARKEIENYALSRTSIARTMIRRSNNINLTISQTEAYSIIEEITENLKQDVLSQFVANVIKYKDKNIDESTTIKSAILAFERIWSDSDKRLEIIPGKDFISILSQETQEHYGFSITTNQLIENIEPDEIDVDLKNIITDIENFFIH